MSDEQLPFDTAGHEVRDSIGDASVQDRLEGDGSAIGGSDEQMDGTPEGVVAQDKPANRPASRLASSASDASGSASRHGRRRYGREKGNDSTASASTSNAGADLERRAGRAEFNDGALVRLRVPIRIDAEAGRDILTDIDVFAYDVDGRLRISRSILECKSGKGQAKEPDRLLWLAGLQRYLRFDRAVLVRQTISRRGRALARALNLRTIEAETLLSREASHAWVPDRFAHIDGPECIAAEARADVQLKGLAHIPAELVAFLRHDALRAEPHSCLRAIATLGRTVDRGGVLPDPTRAVLAGHALIALVAAALSDAGRLDEMSAAELLGRTRRALITGSPDEENVLEILNRADELVTYSIERIHDAYQNAGAKRLSMGHPSLVESVATPPGWVPLYINLAEKLRANPAVARQMLQTIELAVFEAGVGGKAHEAPAFDHLFSPDHRYLLNVAIRCLGDIAGAAIAEALAAALELNFERARLLRGDRDVPPT